MSRRPSQSSLAGAASWRTGLSVALLLVGGAATALAAVGSVSALEHRAAGLLERRERSLREGGVHQEELLRELLAAAAEADAARLDTLACDLRVAAARVHYRLGQPAQAEPVLGQAIGSALRARDRSREFRAKLTLVEARTATDPDGALESVRILQPQVRALRDEAMLGDSYFSEAYALMELGQFPAALIAARRARGHSAAARQTHEELMAMAQISQCLRFGGRHPEARAVTDSLLTRARRHGDSRALTRGLFESASLYRTRHQFDEALAAVHEAVRENTLREDRSALRGALLLRARIHQTMGHPEAAAADVDSLLAKPEVQRSLPQLARVAALKAAVAIELGRPAEADALLAKVANRYERFRAGLAEEEDKVSFGEHTQVLYAAWTRTKLALGQPEEAWRVTERGQGMALEQRLGSVAVPELKALQARLRASRAVLVEYDFPDPATGSVIAVTPDRVVGFPIRAPVVLSDVRLFEDACAATTAAPAADSAGLRLSRILLADVWPLLEGGVRRAIIVPPARLETLPFESLPLPGPGAAGRVGDRLALSYVASAGAWWALDARAVPGSGLTIVADPAVDASHRAITTLEPGLRGTVLQPLPGARQEARRLAEVGSIVLMGRDATLARLRAARPAAVLHFATHAVEDPRDQTRGGLVLAGGDPMLSPARVESLGIAADLVTLSGCGTYGSAAYWGEGTFGLARAFLVAGSRTVIGTRWNISDRAAARFMNLFYAQLRAGAERDIALFRARNRLLAEGFPPRDCWAFLVLGVGDRPVDWWASPGRGSRAPDPK